MLEKDCFVGLAVESFGVELSVDCAGSKTGSPGRGSEVTDAAGAVEVCGVEDEIVARFEIEVGATESEVGATDLVVGAEPNILALNESASAHLLSKSAPECLLLDSLSLLDEGRGAGGSSGALEVDDDDDVRGVDDDVRGADNDARGAMDEVTSVFG